MIYLASPYSDPDPTVREQRYEAACAATAAMLRAGQVVFSPIVHSHPLVAYGLPTDWSFWQRVDGDQLLFCDEVVVLMLDGWDRSAGVREEVRIARELGKPVRYLAPEEPAQPRHHLEPPSTEEVSHNTIDVQRRRLWLLRRGEPLSRADGLHSAARMSTQMTSSESRT